MPLTCVHISLHCVITLVAMISLDVYLVKLNHGDRKTGVLVMLIVEEFCHVVALRYISLWVASQIKTVKRGFAIIAWFVFIVIYDIKMYFILENLWKTCNSSMYNKSNPEDDVITDDIIKSFQYSKDSNPLQSASVKDKSDEVFECFDHIMRKKYLALCQALLVPSLYVMLVGVNYVKGSVNSSLFTKIKLRALWSTAGIFDLIHLQTSIWEEVAGQFPYAVAAFVYFYCYIALILLPSLGLAEMAHIETATDDISTLRVHRISRISLLYVGTSAIRIYLLIFHTFTLTSSIFLGKNLICIALEINKGIQTCTNPQSTTETDVEHPDPTRRSVAGLPVNALTNNGNAVFGRYSTPCTEFSTTHSGDGQESGNSSKCQSEFNSKHKTASGFTKQSPYDEIIQVLPPDPAKNQGNSYLIQNIACNESADVLSHDGKIYPFMLEDDKSELTLLRERHKLSTIAGSDHSKDLIKKILTHKAEKHSDDKDAEAFAVNRPSFLSSPSSSSSSSVFVNKPVEQESLENISRIVNEESTLIIPPPSNFASSVNLNSHAEEKGTNKDSKSPAVADTPSNTSIDTADLLFFEDSDK